MNEQVGRSLSLDDLIALNDEIRALARAGVPLDSGLKAMARDLPGRLGPLANSLGERLAEGENLADALDSIAKIPPAYRAVLVAGLKSGQLASALQGIATTSRRASEFGRLTAVAMVYPIIVLAVASAVFTYSTQQVSPVIADTYWELGFEHSPLVDFPQVVAAWVVPALPWLWGAFFVVAIIWWIGSRRAGAIHTAGLGWLPALSRLIREGRTASFLDVLALLIEQEVPLAEAVGLAAESSGDPQLRAAAQSFARRSEAGAVAQANDAKLSPWIEWLLLSGSKPPQLVAGLRKAAESHHRRAARLGRLVGIYIPVLLSAGLGGAVTLAYVLTVTLPFFQILDRLGR